VSPILARYGFIISPSWEKNTFYKGRCCRHTESSQPVFDHTEIKKNFHPFIHSLMKNFNNDRWRRQTRDTLWSLTVLAPSSEPDAQKCRLEIHLRYKFVFLFHIYCLPEHYKLISMSVTDCTLKSRWVAGRKRQHWLTGHVDKRAVRRLITSQLKLHNVASVRATSVRTPLAVFDNVGCGDIT